MTFHTCARCPAVLARLGQASRPLLVTRSADAEAGTGPGPYASKAIGEASLILTPAAIANAVYDACGVRIFSLPITAEKVWRALRERDNAAGRP